MDFPRNPNDPTSMRLKELLELTRENNAMLKKIRRSGILSNVMRAIYWLLLLGVGFGAYYYLQPYLDELFSTYKTLIQASGVIQGAGIFGGN